MIEICGKKYTKEEAGMLNPLVLAYIGDTVFDLFVRTSLLKCGKAGRLHCLAAKMVCAKAQAEVIKKIIPELTEQEHDIFLRGRNAKSPTVPKNADVQDYRMASGFEALVGYLYITGQDERLREIMAYVTQEGAAE